MASKKQKLLGDQRKEKYIEQSPIAPVKPILKAATCMEALSQCCSACGTMIVSPHVHDGKDCTMSKCGLGFWKGGNSWNRL
jgi:hypothetical protein